MRYMMAADTGGTFTDVAVYDSETRTVNYGKTLTNYADLVEGVLEGLAHTGLKLDEALLLKHGTTHVINTFIQRSGARTALVTTRGFRDSLEIGRGNRPIPFALEYRRDPLLVPRTLRYEIGGRMDAQGNEIEPFDEEGLRALAATLKTNGIEAVAVSFLNSYANPAHEERALALLRSMLPGIYITAGTTLSREWFEYERTSTAVANAYVGSRMRAYIGKFDTTLRERGFRGTFYMMGSNGGVLSVARTLEQPVALVESGPIGGCIGAAAYARALRLPRLIAFDMGGTTAKCALVQDGQFDIQPIYYVGGYDRGFPLKTPVLDIVEVGAGGGSIAAVSADGSLSVGPRSAGSEPGPVAFGRGGIEPTVTDASLVLGHIGGDSFMQGKLKLDRHAALSAIRDRVAQPLGYQGAAGVDIAAQGVLELAATTMAAAIKEITIERGHDVREFGLFAFGGGGPLFGSMLARSLRIPQVIIPPHPGNFSTLGILIAGARIDLSRTVIGEAVEATLSTIRDAFTDLEASARATMKSELAVEHLHFERGLEMRYRGQKHTVHVPYPEGGGIQGLVRDFEAIYERRYGHVNENNVIEVLGVRLGAAANIPRPELAGLAGLNPVRAAQASYKRSVYFPAPHGRLDTSIWRRDSLPVGFQLTGPAIIEEYSATTVLLPGDRATVGELGEIVVEVAAQ